jgi:hypothetical protein
VNIDNIFKWICEVWHTTIPLYYQQFWKPFGIGHMYIHNFLLRMTDIMTSQNIDLSSCDTLYRVDTNRKKFLDCSRWVMIWKPTDVACLMACFIPAFDWLDGGGGQQNPH